MKYHFENTSVPWERGSWVYHITLCFCSISGVQGILIHRIVVGEHVSIVVRMVMLLWTVQQRSGRNHAMFVVVWDTMQDNALRLSYCQFLIFLLVYQGLKLFFEICFVLLQAQDCFICKKGGHRAKDCPEKHTSTSKSIAICLKCGNSGHDIFSCRNDYSQDDLKVILFLVLLFFLWQIWERCMVESA